MNHRTSVIFLSAFCVAFVTLPPPARAAVNVTQHHNHATRDGLYVDPAFTAANAATLVRDTAFDGA
ncbi:MAG: hypothetical protein ABI992_13865, partial [Chthoniobacterales bacterium]